MQLNKNEKYLLQVERACGDLRRGMAVRVTAPNGADIFIAPADNIHFINRLFSDKTITKTSLIISTTRAGYLLPQQTVTAPLAINIADLSADAVADLCAKSPLAVAIASRDATKAEQSALKLAKIAELLPAIITFEFVASTSGNHDFLEVSTDAIDAYDTSAHYSLLEACRTPLTLKYAPQAEIIAYRANVGGAEHYAIIIGTPQAEPLVRVHSSCYTGDLLASLDCDCRDQLQSAIQLMGQGEGGIILYLMQEGRGIGLVNKLRAYGLQDNGMDTVEANRALGFDDDERLFLPAAEILKKLGVSSLRLLTNNPRKASGLEQHGIKVSACAPHIMPCNDHNQAYLQTKADKLGHKL